MRNNAHPMPSQEAAAQKTRASMMRTGKTAKINGT